MPRDPSGTYTLPLAPVVTDTPIATTWANPTMDDLAQSMTDSLSRSGKGGMTAVMKLVDTSVGNTALSPALQFNSESNSGIYRAAQFDIRHSLASEDMLRLYQDGIGDRFFQFWDGAAFQDILYSGAPLTTVLANDTFLTADNQAGDGTVNIVKVNTSNLIEFGAVAATFTNDLAISRTAATAKLNIANTGNGNVSGIEFTRERQDGVGVIGAGIWVASNTANNESSLVLTAESSMALGTITGPYITINSVGTASITLGNAAAVTIPNGNLTVNGGLIDINNPNDGALTANEWTWTSAANPNNFQMGGNIQAFNVFELWDVTNSKLGFRHTQNGGWIFFDNGVAALTVATPSVTVAANFDLVMNAGNIQLFSHETALLTGSSAFIYSTASAFDGVNGSVVLQSRPTSNTHAYIVTGATPTIGIDVDHLQNVTIPNGLLTVNNNATGLAAALQNFGTAGFGTLVSTGHTGTNYAFAVKSNVLSGTNGTDVLLALGNGNVTIPNGGLAVLVSSAATKQEKFRVAEVGYVAPINNTTMAVQAASVCAEFYRSNAVAAGVHSLWVSDVNGVHTECARIANNGAYTQASDYRLKTTTGPYADALAKILSIPVYTGAMKGDPDTEMGLVLAHEVQAQFPELVTGVKDGVSMQFMNYQGMIPYLMAALKELDAKAQIH